MATAEVIASENLTIISAEELNRQIDQLGENERERRAILDRLNQQVAQLISAATEKLQPLVTAGENLCQTIETYATAHRPELTGNRKTKTVKLPSGNLSWRLPSKPAVIFTEDEEELRLQLEKLGLVGFFVEKKEYVPDRDKMIEEKDKLRSIQGIEFKQDEKFSIKPLNINAEITAEKIRKSLPKQKEEASDGAPSDQPAAQQEATTVSLRRKKPR